MMGNFLATVILVSGRDSIDALEIQLQNRPTCVSGLRASVCGASPSTQMCD